MDEVANILEALYELGKAEGREEKEADDNSEKADSFILGYEKGFNDGYCEAMKDFRAPDL